jgi:hypothetical protein
VQSLQSRPGNKGLPLSISAKIQPIDQTSMALVYSLNVSIISGALYHLVATYSVMKLACSSDRLVDLAKPKSQTYLNKNISFILQSKLYVYF